LKCLSKKVVFLAFSGKKEFRNFSTPPGKILEKSSSASPGNNPSDAHGAGIGLEFDSRLGLTKTLQNVFLSFLPGARVRKNCWDCCGDQKMAPHVTKLPPLDGAHE